MDTDTTTDSRVSITFPGMDDCDAATLTGIVRRALEASPEAREYLSGRRDLYVTQHRTWADDTAAIWTF